MSCTEYYQLPYSGNFMSINFRYHQEANNFHDFNFATMSRYLTTLSTISHMETVMLLRLYFNIETIVRDITLLIKPHGLLSAKNCHAKGSELTCPDNPFTIAVMAGKLIVGCENFRSLLDACMTR